jgi:Domain of unknown function DUF11
MRSKSSRVTTVRRKSAYRPRIESMENRLLMAVITVTSTGDAINATDGVVTLREAITAADDNKNISDVIGVGAYGNDTIAFDIPGSGVHTIAPTSPLPIITDPVTIDGYTQPGSAPNTNPVGQGLNGKLLIEIDGEDAGDVRFGMLEFQTTDSVVRGLVINRTQGEKIGIDSVGTAGDILIEGDYIGTDATGTSGFAASPNPNSNARDGVSMGSRGNTIGGTTAAARNLISGNIGSYAVSYGVNDNSSFPLGITNFVQGNLIGTDRTGTVALGNGSGGVAGGSGADGVGQLVVGGPEAGAGNLIAGNGGIGVRIINGVVQGNLIGTDVTGTLPLGNATGVQTLGNVVVEHNTIAFNTVAGVQFTDINDVPTMGNLITQNSIFSNFGPGIGTSSYLNDSPDADGIQNYPTLASVMPSGAGTQAQGTLASKPSSNYRLEFFANAERQADVHDVSSPTIPGEFAEGRTYLGTINVTTNANGLASFTADLPALPAGQPYVTATATDITDDGSGPRHDTSPFSAVAVLGGPSFVVTNTNDSGLGSLREAIINANLTPGTQAITFAIPATDARHFYYRNDGVAGNVTTADIATTTATDDANIADIDPDWPFSWYSIQPDSDLPKIVDTITIDGYSQPGSRQNTLPAPGALNTVLRIELDGTNAPDEGLNLGIGDASGDSSNSRIDGLAINRFGGDGIELDTLDGNNVIAGSFIGTDVSGTVDLGNRGDGVFVDFEAGDTIGGATADSRNLISANDGNGIRMDATSGAFIIGNVVGPDRIAAFALPNGSAAVLFTDEQEAGVFAAVQPLLLSADVDPAPNETRNNLYEGFRSGQGAGVVMKYFGADAYLRAGSDLRDDLKKLEQARPTSNNLTPPGNVTTAVSPALTVQALTAAAPAVLGIDLGLDGVTPNDPGDLDGGPNGFQNFPVLESATTIDGSTTIVGTLNSLSLSRFRIDLYSSSYDTRVIRAGEEFLGSVEVTTDAAGNTSFTFASPLAVPIGQSVISTATLVDAGATSEFSDGITVGDVALQPIANLSVFQSATPNPAPMGGDQTFSLTVASAGPDAASGAQLVVALPAGATFVSATGGVTPVGGTLTFDLGTLANQASVTVSVTVLLNAPGTLVGSATVTSSTLDPTTADNTTTVTVPGDSVGPTISNVLLPNPKAKTTPLVLTFSEDLNPARAVNLANYRLVMAGRDKKFGTKDDKVIALRSATYNPTTHTVTLLPRKKLSVSVAYRITVDGTSATGIADRAGNLLGDDLDGRVSGDYVQIVKLKRSKARR